ncbi:MAG TPA: sortase [Candidatus Bathyarchaeia archaeon]|nr:sortase [Candidatus Bathyarchaeia archaeon]
MPKNPKYLTITGAVFVVAAVILFALIFFPVVTSEVRYALNKDKSKEVVSQEDASAEYGDKNDILVPVDEQFGIVIPKIEANAKVIANVDAENPAAYLRALTQGVAQAAGSANPGEKGNIFLFAHSGQDLLQANRYNAAFYLLSKLEKGDEIDIFFQHQKFQYFVTGSKIVAPEETSDLRNNPSIGQKRLTLMTCWPGGTTLKRLIVVAVSID